MSVLLTAFSLFYCLQICQFCGSPIVIDDNPHLFDQLFFNSTEENGTEIITTQKTTSTTTTTAKPTTKFPTLFSLPELPRLFGFGRSKWMPFGKHFDYAPKLINNPTWRLQLSPPVSWTFCFPNCGSGDQAFDQETAYDNALVDVTAAVFSAMNALKLGVVQEDEVKLRFTPKTTLLEEFQDRYDKNGGRYRVVRGSVRYYYTKTNPERIIENIEEIDISLHLPGSYTETVWKTVIKEISSYLTNEKYAVIHSTPRLASYSVVKNMFFF